MGMFDSIMVPCPTCGERSEFQTKSGPCLLAVWNLEDAPQEALAGVNSHAPNTCEKCGTDYGVHLTLTATPCTTDQLYRDLQEETHKRKAGIPHYNLE